MELISLLKRINEPPGKVQRVKVGDVIYNPVTDETCLVCLEKDWKQPGSPYVMFLVILCDDNRGKRAYNSCVVPSFSQRLFEVDLISLIGEQRFKESWEVFEGK